MRLLFSGVFCFSLLLVVNAELGHTTQINSAQGRGSITYQTLPSSTSNSGSSSKHITSVTGSSGNTLNRSYLYSNGNYSITTTGPGGYSVTKNYDSSGNFMGASTTAPVVQDSAGQYSYQTSLGSVAYSPESQVASVSSNKGRDFSIDYQGKTISNENTSLYVDPSSGTIYGSRGGNLRESTLWSQSPDSADLRTPRGLQVQLVIDPATGDVIGYTGFNDQLNIYSTYDPATHTATIAGPAMGYSIPNKDNTAASGVSETFTNVYVSPANKSVSATNQLGQVNTLYFDPSNQAITTSRGGSLTYNPELDTRDFKTSSGVQGSFSRDETAPSVHTIVLSNGTSYNYDLNTGVFTNQATGGQYVLDLNSQMLIPLN